MSIYKMKYGKKYLEFEYDDQNVINIIKPNQLDLSDLSGRERVIEALVNPIASARLSEIVKSGDTICVVVPDITRVWQSPNIYVPPIIEELNRGGVKDEDNLVYCGMTTYGTPVKLNKKALACDHLVLAGGAIYHFLAGFGGGRKYVMPGIAGYDTIMTNHSYSFNKGLGSGINENVRSGNMSDSNPIHCDMMEAASFAKPTFILNVVVNSDKKITHAFSGNYIKAHEAACKIVEVVDGVEIHEKADMIIASACGYPKDINLYQTSKTLFNVVEAINPDGVIIILSECSEGFGSDATEYMMTKFDNMFDREKDIRESYSIGKGIAYLECDYAEKYTFILVSEMDADQLKNTKIRPVKTIEEALDLAYSIKGTRNLKTIMMPDAANTQPIFKA